MPKRIRNVVHIKRRTAGTSNELSFDVLDAKRDEADAASARGRGKRKTEKERKKWEKETRRAAKASQAEGLTPTSLPQLYTNDVSQASKNIGLASLPYQDPSAEIVRRKKKRSHHRAIVAIAVVIAVGVVGYGLYTEISHYLGDQERGRTLLSGALQEIETADEVVVKMDKLLEGQLDTQGNSDTISAEDISEAQTHLDNALVQAKRASGILFAQQEREASEQAQQAVSAREEMLKQGESVLSTRSSAETAAKNMEDAWDLVLEADALTKEAAKLVEDTTDANVESSMKKSEQAVEKFDEALQLVQQAEQSVSSDDLSQYEEYLSKRIEGQKAALESDAAILLKDREHAERYNQILYDCDSQAADIAKGFPDDPVEVIESAYEEESKSAMDKYSKARAQATSADAYLRDYLGE